MNWVFRLAIICIVFSFGNVDAKTLRFSIADDATTLDPHAANLLVNTRILASVYEGLVGRDKDFNITPLLALSWRQPDAKTWRFKLRPNVKFHDGSPFGADDVVFSLARVMHANSQLKSAVQGVESARKVDELTVDLLMKEPNPVLLNHLFSFRIMSKEWCARNNATAPQNYKDKEDTYASRNTNGTGPYRVTLRQTDVKTRLVENPDWWNKASAEKGNVTEVVWQPIKSNGTRNAALLSGEIDFVIDPPVQDRDRLKQAPNVKLQAGLEARVAYLGFDVFRDELQYSNVKGKNPFKDVRVRRAIAHAIDADLIRSKIYRGYSRPIATIVAPGVQGYAQDADIRYPLDLPRARKLLAEAGYVNGFEVTLDCANAAPGADLCQAVAPMLAQIGIKVTPNLMINTNFVPKIQKFDSSFYFWGWGAPTLDALYVLQAQLRTYTDDKSGNGDANLGRYSNPRVDSLIDRIKVEADMKKRDAMIREVLQIQVAELPLLPIHQVVQPWAMRSNVTGPFAPNNVPYFFRFRID